MLSILIPVFCFDIRPLVNSLHRQGQQLGIPFELLCFDDGSPAEWRYVNREIEGLPAVQYQEMEENLGRSRIRNRLADAAAYEQLLFMDCDAQTPDEQYLDRYVKAMQPGALLYGGRSYRAAPPEDPAFFLHWHYGSQREAMPARQRREKPYHCFMTNNFLIPRRIFHQIRFDERLSQYGHEDTLFGMELRRLSIPIRHIDNPLLHLGLEPAPRFLEKAGKAVQNLAFLHRSGSGVESRLLAFYLKLEQLKLAGLAGWSLRRARPALLRQLRSSRPRLFIFDLYKLSLLLDAL